MDITPQGQNPLGQNPSRTKPVQDIALMTKMDEKNLLFVKVFLAPKMVSHVNKIKNSDGSIPRVYNIYLYLNLVLHLQ